MLHLDVLKVPHHGSNRTWRWTFRKVTATASPQRQVRQPDPETLEMIAAA
jgi:hypothetical protein